MKEADFYPPGAYSDPNAPYNQVDPDPEEIEVDVNEVLVKKNAVISVDDYEEDEDGKYFGCCDLKEGYKNTYLSPKEILDKVVKYATQAKENGDKYFLGEHIDYIIECASDWEVEETDIEES